jgi:hypothetical protein
MSALRAVVTHTSMVVFVMLYAARVVSAIVTHIALELVLMTLLAHEQALTATAAATAGR